MFHLKSRDELGFQIVNNLFLFVLFAALAIPVWRVLISSITPLAYLSNTFFGLWVPPTDWSFEAYKQLLTHDSFVRAALNSAFITVSGTALNLFLTVPLAYALSVRTLPGRRFFVGFILLTFLFNAGLVPTYLVVRSLGLFNSYAALILPGAVSVYYTLVMKSFFEGIPEDLKEAARMDGANELQVLFHVVLPLSKPILLTIGLFYAVGHWNEFFSPILYLTDNDLMPLPVLVRTILTASGINEFVDFNAFSQASIESVKAASVFISMIPMLVLYPWIQRYFTRGTLVGGIK